MYGYFREQQAHWRFSSSFELSFKSICRVLSLPSDFSLCPNLNAMLYAFKKGSCFLDISKAKPIEEVAVNAKEGESKEM